MAATVSLLATRFGPGQAAAIAAAAGGGIVTADITALAAVLTAMATCPDIMIPLLGEASTPASASTMLVPA